MFHKLRKKLKVTHEEILADFVFILVGFLLSVLALFIFDIHWNFYPGGTLFPPEKYIFQEKSVYVWGGLLGSIIFFFIIKLLLVGIREEESRWGRTYHD